MHAWHTNHAWPACLHTQIIERRQKSGTPHSAADSWDYYVHYVGCEWHLSVFCSSACDTTHLTQTFTVLFSGTFASYPMLLGLRTCLHVWALHSPPAPDACLHGACACMADCACMVPVLACQTIGAWTSGWFWSSWTSHQWRWRSQTPTPKSVCFTVFCGFWSVSSQQLACRQAMCGHVAGIGRRSVMMQGYWQFCVSHPTRKPVSSEFGDEPLLMNSVSCYTIESKPL